MSDRDDSREHDEPRESTGRSGLSRRAFLATAGGAGAAVAAATVAGSATAASASTGTKVRTVSQQVDVAIVGAGLSGLIAARQLVRAHRSVVVLEARNRTGGRIHSAPIGKNKIIEIGAEFVSPDHHRMLALLKDLKIQLFPTFDQGATVLNLGGRVTRPAGVEGLPVPPDAVAEVLDKVGQIDAMADQVPLDAPQQAPEAAAWDSQTLSSWLDQNVVTAGARLLLTKVVSFPLGCEPDDASLLHYMFLVHSHGGVVKLGSIKGGAQDSRVVGGTQVIIDRLAAQLNGRIALNSAVRKIDQTGKRVRLSTDLGTYEAQRVIVAIPPTLAGRIAYAPVLPPLRDQLTQRTPMGYATKAQAIYPTPFWRSDGLSGASLNDVGPASLTFDNSPEDGTPGVLLGFLFSNDARRWGSRPAAERRGAILDQFARLFGPQAKNPTQYLEQDWAAEEWTRGGTSMFMPTGMWTEYGPQLRAPVGRIHWAGTETGTDSTGAMESAIEAGQRAASEVV